MSNDLQFSIGADGTDLNRGLSAAAANAERYGGQISEKLGKKLGGIEAVSQSLATALGLNLQNIAEGVARWFTGMSKEEEAAYARSDELGAKATELAQRNMRARLTDEQRYQLAVQERDKLLDQINTTEIRNGADMEKVALKRIALEEKVGEIQAYEAKQREEQQKAYEQDIAKRVKANEEEFKTRLDTLDTEDKIATLKGTIAATQALINTGVLNQRELEMANNQLAERKNLLLSAEAKRKEEIARAEEKAAEDHIKAMDRLQQLKFDRLSIEEQVNRLAAEEAQIVRSIADMKKSGLDTAQAEIALMETQLALAEKRANVEQRTAEIADKEAKRKAQLEKIESRDYLGDFLSSMTTGALDPERRRKIQQASDETLEEMKRRLTKELEAVSSPIWSSIADFGFGRGLQRIPITTDLATIQTEQQLRRGIRSDAAFGGYDLALRNFKGDPLSFDRLYQDFVKNGGDNEEQRKRTVDALEDIKSRLSGEKPIFGTTRRTR